MGWPANRCGEPVRLGERQGPDPLMGYGHKVICMNDNYLQQILSILACNLFLLSLRCSF
jgi:hypothetical protein